MKTIEQINQQPVFANKNYTKRNYDVTNVIACRAEVAPTGAWVPADESILNGLTPLYIVGNVRYYGHL